MASVQIKFPGERYAAAANNDLGGFTLQELLDANYEISSGNIFVVGRPNFPEPSMDAAYDFVPIGLARQAVRRDEVVTTARWVCQSYTAWTAVAEAFRNDEGLQGAVVSDSERSNEGGWMYRFRGSDIDEGKGVRHIDNTDGTLTLPPHIKYGPEWWESTLRIIVYDAAAETAAYGLERALAVPDIKRGAMEIELMTTAALYLEAAFRGYRGR